ncbi:ATP-binding cassette domain-containing protein [Formicincola oecophyllae]|nr:ABC transporter ATP-binding protein [Formicincola oecophyllae]
MKSSSAPTTPADPVNVHVDGALLPWRPFLAQLMPTPRWAVWLRLASAAALLALEGAASVATPWFFAAMVDKLGAYKGLPPLGAHGTSTNLALHLSAAMAALLFQFGLMRFLGGVAGPVRDMVAAPLRAALRERAGNMALAHLQRLGARYHASRQTGALVRTVERGVDAIGTLLDLALSNVLPNIITLLLTFSVILHVFSPSYLAALVATAVLYGLVSRVFTKLRLKARRLRNQRDNAVSHHLVDCLMNAETVRSFGAEDHEQARHGTYRGDLRQAETRLQLLVSASQGCRAAVIALSSVLLLGLAWRDIALGRIGVAQFVLVGTYLRSVYSAVGVLNYVSVGWLNALVDLERYRALLAQGPEIIFPTLPAPATTAALAGHAGPEIRFEHVSFAYEKGQDVLEDVSFTIPAGVKAALVGESGSGKSTIACLLCRDYDPTAGHIYINGRDITTLTLGELRNLTGVVSQDCTLFDATMGDNIAYGRLGSTAAEVAQAAEEAALGPLLARLPLGLETVVGERGVKLSGGERQRLAVARVLLRRPRLLILDEATSALDSHTEAAIQKRLDDLVPWGGEGQPGASHNHPTTVVVAHRLSTIANASLVLVMDKGRLVEAGSHRALLARPGFYHDLWARQNHGPKAGLVKGDE